jgi:hypothetical protein
MTGEESPVDDAAEDRQLFGEQLRTRAAYVACDLGIARASLAGGRVGHAGVVERCTAMSVAADSERVVAGTVRGVLVDEGEGFERVGEPFEVAAVGLAGGRVLAAGADGRVLVWDSEYGWRAVGTVSDPQRFDGAVLAAGNGVYRVTESLEPLGLSGVHDVAGESPFVATEDGIYRQSNSGWELEHDRPAATVIAAGGSVHAIDDRGILERTGGTWSRVDTPALPVDLAYAGVLCGITGDGTVLVDEPEQDGYGTWRSHPLGLRGVVEFAVQ